MSITTLLIEDDMALAVSVAEFLGYHNIQVEQAWNGRAGLNLAHDNHYDVILLDLMLPRMDGLTVCDQLRQAGIDTPVLMLTARDTLADKEAGFAVGTDDYLVKPFAMKELVLRIQALARRRSSQSRRLQVGELIMELDTCLVSRAGQPVHLPPNCWALLEALMRASPSVVSRDELMHRLWPDDIPDSDSFKVHLYRLRQRVDKPFNTPMIYTLPGKGIFVKAALEASGEGQ